MRLVRTWVTLLIACATASAPAQERVEVDLLVVGGTEAGVAAAVQAARLGVKRIALVNDVDWLGGQFSAEGVGCLDEWTTVRGRRVEFPRSGAFLEILRKIREHNRKTYGLPRPGNAFCGSETIEPAAAAKLFADWLAPYGPGGTGQVRVWRRLDPIAVRADGNTVVGAAFAPRGSATATLEVRARLTIDASDWGDIVGLSKAAWAAGPDLRSRFGEPNAPEALTPADANEMNPISYCLVLRERLGAGPITAPPGYDERAYFGTTGHTAAEFAKVGWPKGAQRMNVPAFADTAHVEGIYSSPVNVYTHRRLVDRRHNGLPEGTEKLLVNWPTQDYPLYDWPKGVADALERTERGASTKNLVALAPAQRQIVFDDAKRHALGMLRHLQTTVHDRLPKGAVSFRDFELSDEFGTLDRLPPKPYVREGRRLEALAMVREGDLRMTGPEPGWAAALPSDAVFGFQFNIDFHPTRRVFLGGDRAGPWANVHTPTRNWSTHTDRSALPLRSLVPREVDGLLGAGKTIGVSSIVSSAVRLHGQMMLCGQAAGTVAAECLEANVSPRALSADVARVRRVQAQLVRGADGQPGVLLWPYQDLSPDESSFEAANLLAVRGIYAPRDSVDFEPMRGVSRREMAEAFVRAGERAFGKPPAPPGPPFYRDVAPQDRRTIETLVTWMNPPKRDIDFRPDAPADWGTLAVWLDRLGWPSSPGLAARPATPVLRLDLATFLWRAVRSQP